MPYFLALLGGVTLAFSQPPSRRYWLQLVAFAPLLWTLGSKPIARLISVLAGRDFRRELRGVNAVGAQTPSDCLGGFGGLANFDLGSLRRVLLLEFRTLPPLWSALWQSARARRFWCGSKPSFCRCGAPRRVSRAAGVGRAANSSVGLLYRREWRRFRVAKLASSGPRGAAIAASSANATSSTSSTSSTSADALARFGQLNFNFGDCERMVVAKTFCRDDARGDDRLGGRAI